MWYHIPPVYSKAGCLSLNKPIDEHVSPFEYIQQSMQQSKTCHVRQDRL